MPFLGEDFRLLEEVALRRWLLSGWGDAGRPGRQVWSQVLMVWAVTSGTSVHGQWVSGQQVYFYLASTTKFSRDYGLTFCCFFILSAALLRRAIGRASLPQSWNPLLDCYSWLWMRVVSVWRSEGFLKRELRCLTVVSLQHAMEGRPLLVFLAWCWFLLPCTWAEELGDEKCVVLAVAAPEKGFPFTEATGSMWTRNLGLRCRCWLKPRFGGWGSCSLGAVLPSMRKAWSSVLSTNWMCCWYMLYFHSWGVGAGTSSPRSPSVA